MKPKAFKETGIWMIPDVPRTLMNEAKAHAHLRGQTVRTFLIELVQAHLQVIHQQTKVKT